jgi:hypothetical protein
VTVGDAHVVAFAVPGAHRQRIGIGTGHIVIAELFDDRCDGRGVDALRGNTDNRGDQATDNHRVSGGPHAAIVSSSDRGVNTLNARTRKPGRHGIAEVALLDRRKPLDLDARAVRGRVPQLL